MRRAALLLAGLLVTAVFGAAILAGAVAGTAIPGGDASAGQATGGSAGGPPSDRAVASIPPMYLSLDQHAAVTCPGLPWTVLAAIGTVESDNGQSLAAGVRSGANFAGAEGPMQFEPTTFSSVAVVGPGGADPPSPYDPVDAVYSAARLLCTDGGGDPATIARAIYSYNHSADYVAQVLSLASSYSASSTAGQG